ncbi:MAG: hypothetical protein KGZ81_14840 [Flavobacteriales bacterium]|nr:hypothetical protein [Flavobacteriales bacterium]
MKHWNILLLLFIGFTFAQRNTQPNPISDQAPLELVGKKIFQNGERLSNYDVKNHLKNNHPNAYLSYKKYQTKSAVGGLLFAGGTVLVIGDLVKHASADEKYPGGFTYVGIGMMAISIPIISGRKKYLEQSIEMVNTENQIKSKATSLEIQLVHNFRGTGIQIQF